MMVVVVLMMMIRFIHSFLYLIRSLFPRHLSSPRSEKGDATITVSKVKHKCEMNRHIASFRRKARFLVAICVIGTNASFLHGLQTTPGGKSRPPLAASTPTSTDKDLSRRQLLFSGATATTVAVFLPCEAANAARAKGAAELDLEFYMRDLINGNKKEGSILPSKNGPPVPPPRKLTGNVVPMLLNNECNADCIPVQALIEEIREQDKAAGRPISDEGTIVKNIQLRVDAIREKTKTSFFTKTPWKDEDISDQYYFDFTIYALWKTAAQLIENNENRDRFMRNVGRLLVSKLEKEKLLSESLLVPQESKDNGVLVGSIPAIVELLNIFNTSEYCKSYRIRSSDNMGAVGDDVPVFDELDDESLSMVGTVNCLVSIYEPATLGASLQINGENSRFAPDFVGTSLAAIWEKYGGIRTTWDVFFVDPEYRPNPKDYFPNEQLLQMTLNKK